MKYDMDEQLEALGAVESVCNESYSYWLCTYHLGGVHVASGGDAVFAIWDDAGHAIRDDDGIWNAYQLWQMWTFKYALYEWEAR